MVVTNERDIAFNYQLSAVLFADEVSYCVGSMKRSDNSRQYTTGTATFAVDIWKTILHHRIFEL
jgi:hypothetical protein